MLDSLALVRRFALAIPLTAFLAGCSGGGGSPPAPGGGGAPGSVASSLFIDTAAGSAAELDGQIVAVALEAPDGTLTDNLLSAPVSVPLARPDGEGALVALHAIPRGVFVALHLMIGEGSLRARTVSGAVVRVEPTVHGLRIPFPEPWDVDVTRARIAVRHAEPVVLVPGPGGTLSWDPNVDVVPTDVIPVRFGRVDVVAIDRPGARVSGILTSMDERPIELTFAADALLLREPFLDPLTEAAFLDGLAVGTRLLVDGLLDLEDNLLASAAVDLGPSEPIGRGNKGELEGRIVEFLPERDAFRIAILDLEKGEHLLPSPTPGMLVVDAAGARIKWTPRRGRHRGHLPFSALEVGMVVEVSWHGAAVAGEIDADKVDIRSQGRCFGQGFEGSVTAVSIERERIEIRLDDPVVIGGRELRDLEIEVDRETLVARVSPSAMRLVELGEIVIGENARVLVEERGNGRHFEASLIVLEWR